jgi:hypothetical protein
MHFRHPFSSRVLGTLVALALTTTASLASADDASAAQALYERAVELIAAKNYDEACPKLKEVTRLVPEGLGAKLTLAECYESQGKLASAWTQYTVVESMAARTGQTDRQKAAGEKAAALRPKLAMLTIQVPDAVKQLPELTVERDGEAIGAAQFGEAIPIDIGKHKVQAKARGKKTWEAEPTIPADGATLSVEVPMLEEDPNAKLHETPGGASAPDPGPTWLFPVGFAVGGTGVAALIVGGVLGGLAISEDSAGDDACPGGLCTPDGNASHVQAGTFADAGTGLLVAGGVLAAGGVLMIIFSPHDDETAPAQKDAVTVRVVPYGVGAAVTGSF